MIPLLEFLPLLVSFYFVNGFYFSGAFNPFVLVDIHIVLTITIFSVKPLVRNLFILASQRIPEQFERLLNILKIVGKLNNLTIVFFLWGLNHWQKLSCVNNIIGKVFEWLKRVNWQLLSRTRTNWLLINLLAPILTRIKEVIIRLWNFGFTVLSLNLGNRSRLLHVNILNLLGLVGVLILIFIIFYVADHFVDRRHIHLFQRIAGVLVFCTWNRRLVNFLVQILRSSGLGQFTSVASRQLAFLVHVFGWQGGDWELLGGKGEIGIEGLNLIWKHLEPIVDFLKGLVYFVLEGLGSHEIINNKFIE